MNDYKDIILTILSILIPAIVAILGYIIHRKTEHIKIMESQLSDKKYIAYAGLVEMFFRILKNTKKTNVSNDNLAEQMVDLKRIFYYMVLIKCFTHIIIFLMYPQIILVI